MRNPHFPTSNSISNTRSHMWRSKMPIDAIQHTSPSNHPSSSRHPNKKSSTPSSSSSGLNRMVQTRTPSSLNRNTTTTSSSLTTQPPKNTTTTSSSSTSSSHSLASLRSSLPRNPHFYDISKIRAATNNFLVKTYGSTSSTCSSTRRWQCQLLDKDVTIFQRKTSTQLTPSTVRRKLSSLSKSHHVAIINLIGVSLSGEYIYFVYDFVHGVSLHDLLHNKINPDYTVLNSWMSRIQIASDIANGLDYIHNNTGLDVTFVHNHVKSSSVIVTEPSFSAKLCHFGVSELCGEPTKERERGDFGKKAKIEEIVVDDDGNSVKTTSPWKSTRSNSVKFNGTRGYMSPEFQATGMGTRKSDVYAFGVVLIELLSGEEPVKYKLDKATRDYRKISAVDAARAVVGDGGGGGGEREGRLRKWVDRRLRDSFPVEVVEKLTRLAVDCIHVEADNRPDMRRVAGKISKLYLESQAWCERMSIPTDFTVSFAPR